MQRRLGISGHHACNTRRPFYKIGRLDIRRQTITPIDKWLALFSQSMPASLYCVPQISLDRGADVRFLDGFSDRFRSVGFLDRFRWQISCGRLPSIGRGLTCKDRWSVRSFEASGRIFMTNNSPAAISNACYTALRNNFDPFIQMTTINGAHFNGELNIHPSTFNICQLWEKVREPFIKIWSNGIYWFHFWFVEIIMIETGFCVEERAVLVNNKSSLSVLEPVQLRGRMKSKCEIWHDSRKTPAWGDQFMCIKSRRRASNW